MIENYTPQIGDYICTKELDTKEKFDFASNKMGRDPERLHGRWERKKSCLFVDGCFDVLNVCSGFIGERKLTLKDLGWFEEEVVDETKEDLGVLYCIKDCHWEGSLDYSKPFVTQDKIYTVTSKEGDSVKFYHDQGGEHTWPLSDPEFKQYFEYKRPFDLETELMKSLYDLENDRVSDLDYFLESLDESLEDKVSSEEEDIEKYLYDITQEVATNESTEVKSDKGKSDWTASHYDFNYKLTPEDIEKGHIKLDPYFVSKEWGIGTKDPSGCLWHTFKTCARFGVKNEVSREIKAIHAQTVRMAELYGVNLDEV